MVGAGEGAEATLPGGQSAWSHRVGGSPQGQVHTYLRTSWGDRTFQLAGRPPGSLPAQALGQVLGTKVRANHSGPEEGDTPVPGRAWAAPRPAASITEGS